MNRLFSRLFAVLAIAVVLTAAYLAWKRHSTVSVWITSRPPLPALLGSAAPGLDARLAACAARFASWPPDRAALAEFSQVCHANGHLAAAAAGYRSLIALEPAEPRWPHLLALIIAGYGQLDEALPLLRRTTELAPEYLAGWLKLGDALLKSNATDDAATAYRAVLQRDPDNPFALLGLARCDLQAERLTAARANLQRAVASRPDFASAQSLLGTVFERLGNAEAAAAARARVAQGGHYGEAPDAWAEALVFFAHDPYTLLIAASAALADAKPERAHRLLARGLELAPDDARLHRQLGKLLAIDGDYVGSRRELERAVALDPANDAIRFDLLAILRRTGDEAGFERVVLAGLEASPASAGLHLEAGRIAAKNRQLAEATQHLQTSWRTGPDQPAAGLELADLYFETNDVAAGLAVLEDVSRRFPQENTALLMLVRHGTQSGHPRTRDWLRRAAASNAPPALLAELRENYHRRFGAPIP
jgi:predicted Zn-dependent protease